MIEWILKPAFGAAVLWFGTFCKKQYQNHQFRKKHSIRGPYVGYAEGERNGSPVMEKEVVTVRQSISRIKGDAKSVNLKRLWDIKGEILEGGCVSGSYASGKPGDNSRGTFFLEPVLSVPGEYAGVWAGYDANHKMVRSGKYRWRKILEPRIAALKNDRTKHKALAILALSLGKKYIEEASFEKFLRGKDTRVALGACKGKELIGVALAKVMDEGDIKFFDPQAKAAGVKIPLSNFGRLGHLRSIAIADGFRNLGVGTRLCMECIKYLQRESCTAVFTVAWEPGPLPPSPPQPKSSQPELSGPSLSMLKTAGFQPLATIKEFWKVDDPQKDHECPRCGFPCLCTAIFCIKQL